MVSALLKGLCEMEFYFPRFIYYGVPAKAAIQPRDFTLSMNQRKRALCNCTDAAARCCLPAPWAQPRHGQQAPAATAFHTQMPAPAHVEGLGSHHAKKLILPSASSCQTHSAQA